MSEKNNNISSYFEKAKSELQAERDSMTQKIKEEISQSKRKALSKS